MKFSDNCCLFETYFDKFGVKIIFDFKVVYLEKDSF